MKTRLLIIIGIVVAVSIILVALEYDQKTKSFMEIITIDAKSESTLLPDPICLATESSSGVGSVMLEKCFTSSEFEEMGCTKPMLEHILRHSNLLDYEVDGLVYLDWAGLPSGVSQEKFDECYNSILEKRPILNSKNQDKSKSCPHGQEYNEALFKCVISCSDDLVYNGYTDSCTTYFEQKYHGFCNEGYTYQPSTHTCLSDEDAHVPLKDPPRTAPPEPEPEITSRYEKYLDENNELNFGLRYDKNGMIIDDLQRIYDWCDYTGEKPNWHFSWSNQTHIIDSGQCKWHVCDDGKINYRGICMTPEAKEKAQSVGEFENED